MQQLKMHLKEWNQNVFGRLENRKAEILKKVLWLDNEAESRDLNEGEMLLKAEIAMEMEEIARMEEISWRQKSRCLWLELGDKNTKFFHKMANLHRRSNHIESLEANGSILENEEQFNNEILSFYESLYTVTDLWRPSWSQDNMAAISEEENQWLQRPFDEEEILGVIKDCNGDKAPGPDGFTMEFYKKCWNIIKFDLIGALNHFHIHERFEKSFNASYIALIQKKVGAKELKDYRPISLIGSFYKVLSKLLANRLRSVMGKLVSNSQLAFIKGRQIVDAALIANECIDSRMKQKKPGILCKLDIEKAFDNVHWEFLINILKLMGFGEKWIKWISYCISTVKLSIIINGTPKGFFATQKGLRQGDPLSPFLFTLVMEGLSRMLATAEQQGWIQGFNPNVRDQGQLQISHLLYADDSLIFCGPEREQILHLRMVLLFFEVVSGLHINYAKSIIYPVNEVDNILEVAEIMGCGVGSFPSKYLGLPLGSKAKATSIWNDILEKCEKKLSTWKRNYLSLGGRLVLINSVLGSLPTYTMSLFPLPVSVAKRLDKLRRDFLWQGNREHKSFNLVKWQTITLDRRAGGLGVKNLKVHSASLLHKWLWRFSQEEAALWRIVIATKYDLLNPWTTKSPHFRSSHGLWKYIRLHWNSFLSNSSFQVGNVRKLKFWTDIWADQSSLKEQFPVLFTLAQDQEASIHDYWTESGWNLRFRRGLNDWEVDSVSALLLILQNHTPVPSKPDSLIWKRDSKGIFQVKSCYQILSPSGSFTKWPWKCIWKNRAPLKVDCFVWLVAHGACLTHENLQKRGIHICSRCPLCEKENEDVNHLFIHCEFTTQIWHLILSIVGVTWTMPKTTTELLQSWCVEGLGKEKLAAWFSLPSAIWWIIWKERNSRIFESRKESVLSIKSKCISLLFFWCHMATANDAEAVIDFMSSLYLSDVAIPL